MNDQGAILFSANHREVEVGAENLKVSGEGGSTFSGSVQTTLVRAKPGNDLRYIYFTPKSSFGAYKYIRN